MTKEQKVILSLIRTAITGKVEALPAGVDWSKVIDFAMQQGVLGIAFDGIERVSEFQKVSGVSGGFPDMDNLMDWLGQVEYMKTCYEEHKRAISELAEFYADNGVKMMLLKGYGLSLYWPTPEHRPVGDIDIYLRPSKSPLKGDLPIWQFADQMVHDKLRIEIDKDHHHHTTISFMGTMVENHYDFINVHAHRDAPKIEAKLKELASKGESLELRAERGSGQEDSLSSKLSSLIYLPSADFNALFLLRHMGQHFAGEKVTLRQLLDWWFFLKHEREDVNWAETDAFLKEIGLYDFKVMINHICEYICENASVVLSPIEKRILNDVLEPEFTDDGSIRQAHGKLGSGTIWFKLKRWMANRWKHRLVYNENLITMFFTLAMSHVRGPKV